MTALYDMVKNVIVYLLLVTIVMNLIGDGVYKKYVGVFTGIVLIIIVLKPVMALFGMNQSFDYYTIVNQFSASEVDMSEQLLFAEESQKNSILTVYQADIKSQVNTIAEKYGYQVGTLDFLIDEEEDYGRIKNMSIGLDTLGDPMEKSEDSGNAAIWIEEIELEPGGSSSIQKATEDLETGDLKKEIAGVYKIPVESIEIHLQ